MHWGCIVWSLSSFINTLWTGLCFSIQFTMLPDFIIEFTALLSYENLDIGGLWRWSLVNQLLRNSAPNSHQKYKCVGVPPPPAPKVTQEFQRGEKYFLSWVQLLETDFISARARMAERGFRNRMLCCIWWSASVYCTCSVIHRSYTLPWIRVG